MLTDLQLAQIMIHASQKKRLLYVNPLNAAMEEFEINNLQRASAFIAQLAHESGEFNFMEEIWGPTPAQRRYEPPSDLARTLGNTQPGDGKRFKGRGPIQLTGRANYQKFGDLLGVDLVGQPELAATPELAFKTAGLYWKRKGLNELADADNFTEITRRINGGQNGAAERVRFYERAKLVLAPSFQIAGAGQAKAKTAKTFAEPADALMRGAESIRLEPAPPAFVPPPSESLTVRPDTLDFRDLMYTPTLIEVPSHIPLGEYLEHQVPILNQGSEGACTGFGLATVANYLLQRRRVVPDSVPVSPRMLYDLARRYDEWPGENYSGSSARGAMKGWHKHGICSEELYPYQPGKVDRRGMTEQRVADGMRRPLGAYFRVNHKDLVAMHAAIAEVGVLYATATVHEGWNSAGTDGLIVQSEVITGGHAFAIVAYDDQGFWLQNSWGPTWGLRGFARVTYDDWLANGTDVWVARLGAPVTLRAKQSAATTHSATANQSVAYSFADLRPHIVSVGNDGELKAGGDYGSTPDELGRIFEQDIPAASLGWKKLRVLLYAHGGLVSEQAAVQRLAEYRPELLKAEVYPLAFIWRTDYWTTFSNILKDAVSRRRPEGALDATKDFMLDRLDDALEPLARVLSGKAAWNEMKENALRAAGQDGASTLVVGHLKKLAKTAEKNGQTLEIHLVGHSAGSILHAPIVKLLAARGLPVETCTLWAPACTVKLFKDFYVPAMESKALRKLTVYALKDKTERDDDCAKIYNKSLLYLVSNAFEEQARIPLFRDGVPILGMEKAFDPALRKIFNAHRAELVLTPNTDSDDSLSASEAMHHGDFDDDKKTVMSTFRRIAAGAGKGQAKLPDMVIPIRSAKPMFPHTESSLRDRRMQIDQRTRERL
ncbi:putative chitinase/putative alpha/beta hydrolase family esterase [Variovorax paradoxus]|uniref:Chitinase/putative alpha/beta hydrolase family esterase n=1 Tax=Variovorax paradoxus TaxID=34073 RepID=A0AAW8ES00_VARPD|nr:C1 family peptidase [Variovorax paradoxus]MDP9975264.1 putative chitinase/putative alpha/beta hydrolase family esterase [Variovorax paradoxus]